MLEAKLRDTDPRLVRIWSRWRPISSLPLLALFIHRGYAEIHSTSSIGFVETNIPWKRGVASLWCGLTQLDNFMKTTIKLIIPLILGYTIICDRYVLDLLVEGMADLHDSSTSKRLGYRLLKLLPRPDIAFFIDVNPQVAFSRKPDLPSLTHFIERVQLYRELSKAMEEKVLDGGGTRDRIRDEIYRRILIVMKNQRRG